MARPRDYLMGELRKAQQALIAAKKRRNATNAEYLRAKIAELQQEMEQA